MRRTGRPGWARALALALALASSARAATPALETEVKAVYLAKFAPFVVWPPGVFPSPDSPVSLCVQGDDPFGPALDSVAASQHVAGRPVVVRRVARLGADSGCQIAYVAGSSEQPRAAALKAVEGLPVLTVTDDAASPGIVRLVLLDGRVRFEIDADKARQSGLQISSRLLALAVGPR